MRIAPPVATAFAAGADRAAGTGAEGSIYVAILIAAAAISVGLDVAGS